MLKIEIDKFQVFVLTEEVPFILNKPSQIQIYSGLGQTLDECYKCKIFSDSIVNFNLSKYNLNNNKFILENIEFYIGLGSDILDLIKDYKIIIYAEH